MKTKVVQHDPRISITHMTYDSIDKQLLLCLDMKKKFATVTVTVTGTGTFGSHRQKIFTFLFVESMTVVCIISICIRFLYRNIID